MGVKIVHISYHLSDRKVTNEDLACSFPEYTAAKILKKTGVKIRYNTSEGIIGSDLAFSAAQKLFQESNYIENDVEFLIFVSEGLDYIAPSTACILQNRLGLSQQIGALDVPGGCAGFTNALGVAKALIESGQTSNVLLLLGDIPSIGIHPEDVALKGLFSDSGAALLIEKDENFGIGNFIYGSDGSGAKNLFVERSGFRDPIDEDWVKKYKDVGGMPIGRLQMNGLEIFTFSLSKVPKFVNDILSKNKLKFEDIDLFVFHQASHIILKSLQRKMKISDEKMVYCIEKFGNTVSMTIPIALCELEKENKLLSGTKVLIAGFGIGYSWSGTVIQY